MVLYQTKKINVQVITGKDYKCLHDPNINHIHVILQGNFHTRTHNRVHTHTHIAHPHYSISMATQSNFTIPHIFIHQPTTLNLHPSRSATINNYSTQCMHKLKLIVSQDIPSWLGSQSVALFCKRST